MLLLSHPPSVSLSSSLILSYLLLSSLILSHFFSHPLCLVGSKDTVKSVEITFTFVIPTIFCLIKRVFTDKRQCLRRIFFKSFGRDGPAGRETPLRILLKCFGRAGPAGPEKRLFFIKNAFYFAMSLAKSLGGRPVNYGCVD